MINIAFRINPNTSEISFVSVKGHADFDSYGNDIVCASVSALLIATINGLEEYVGIDTQARIESGCTEFCIQTEKDYERTQAQAIVHTFYLAMNGLQDEYEDYIEIMIEEKKND